MSDIGGIFSPLDLALIVLIAGAPGLVLGALGGALLCRGRRRRGALAGAAAGFVLALAGWWITLTLTP